MKQKRKTLVIPFPLFGNLRVRWIFFYDASEYTKFRQKEWDDHPDSYYGSACCGYSDDSDSGIYHVDCVVLDSLIVKGDMFPSIVHEVTHAVKRIAEHYGVMDEEFDAYTSAYMVRSILKKWPNMRTR